MTIAEKIVKLNEDADKLIDLNNQLEQILYGADTGSKSYYDEFWDAFQNYGNRAYYGGAFKYSAFEEIKPKYKIIPTDEGSGYNTFMYCKKLKKIEAKYVDFSQIPRGRYASGGLGYTFCSDNVLEEIEDIGLSPSHTYAYTFAWCYKLKTIAKITVDEATLFDNSFTSCNALENITFEGEIGNDINFKWSTKLTKASIESIINHLSDEATGKTLTLSDEAVDEAYKFIHVDEETGEQHEMEGSINADWTGLVATKPNWTINLV